MISLRFIDTFRDLWDVPFVLSNSSCSMRLSKFVFLVISSIEFLKIVQVHDFLCETGNVLPLVYRSVRPHKSIELGKEIPRLTQKVI